MFAIAFATSSLLSAHSRQASRKAYRQILAGETLPVTFLTREAQRFEQVGPEWCDGETLLAVALIELQLAERSLSEGRSDDADRHLRNASSRAKGQIACSPTDGFAWFVAFWVDFLSGNLAESTWSYIDASYRFAPHEAWVALVRLPLLAKMGRVVPGPRRSLILDDFEMLMNGGFVSPCARLFAFASPEWRTELLRLLAKLPETRKQQFNQSLRPYDVDPVPTARGKWDAERLRTNLKGLTDALGAGREH